MCAKLRYVWVNIHKSIPEASFLIDTGAAVSLLSKTWYDKIPPDQRPLLRPAPCPLKAGNNTNFKQYGCITMRFQIQGLTMRHKFWVVDTINNGLLGLDFLEKEKAIIDNGKRFLVIRNTEVRVHDQQGQPFHNKVTVAKTVYLAPGQETMFWGRVHNVTVSQNDYAMIEPAQLAFQKSGALIAKTAVSTKEGLVPMRAYNPCDEVKTLYHGTTVGILTDITEAIPLELGSNSQLKRQTEVNKSTIEPQVQNTFLSQESSSPEAQIPEHVQELYLRDRVSLTYAQDTRFQRFLTEYSEQFAKNSNDIGVTQIIKHDIPTGDAPPVRQRVRRLPQEQIPILQKQIDSLHEKGIIRPSQSEWASNVLLVRKKDGTWRLCIDYRELNNKTKAVDPYMLPRIDDTLDALSHAKYFATLDLIAGYHQIELTDEAKPKTAFVTPRITPSHWEYNFMPFGVQGGPSTFQRLMDKLLHGLEYKIALAYLDDIIVYAPSIDELLDRCNVVFARLREAGLKVKPSKCFFFQTETKYLGHVVSGNGVSCDPEKIKAVKSWPVPRNIRDVRSFIGTVAYYKRFIRNFAQICRPLHALTCKNAKFQWTIECEAAFQELKRRLTSAPVMAYPQAEGRYILDTDASSFAIGAVLSQEQFDEVSGKYEEKVIAYASRVLQPREQRYCTRRRELLAIVFFVKKFRPYLYGRDVLIRTDHASLKYIKSMKDPNDQFARWIISLEETKYTIETRHGKSHANADGLSRAPRCEGKHCICAGVADIENTSDSEDTFRDHGSTIFDPIDDFSSDEEDDMYKGKDIRIIDPSETMATEKEKPIPQVNNIEHAPPVVNVVKFAKLWTVAEMQTAQMQDPDICPVLSAKTSCPDCRPHWREISIESQAAKVYWSEWDSMYVRNGCLYRKWESNNGQIERFQLVLPYIYRDVVLEELHNAKTSGHMGRRRTMSKIQERFFWYKMREDVIRWIKTCERCQRRKRPGKTARAPLVNYTMGAPMERIGMDICGPFIQTSRGNRVILVISDYFSKWTQAVPLPNHEASTVAEALVTHWISLWGCPYSIHTDKGTDFESKLMHELCNVLGIEKTRTTSYHPASDGQVERDNATIQQLVNAIGDNYEEWDLYLPLAMMAYRATRHDTTGESPNMMLTGRQMTLPLDVMIKDEDVREPENSSKYVRRLLHDLRACHQRVRDTTGKAALTQKRYYDRHTFLNQYERGDLVLLKTGKRTPRVGKWEDRWIGPYVIVNKLASPVLYRIQKDEFAKPMVVHHDRMKPFYARTGEEIDISWLDSESDANMTDEEEIDEMVSTNNDNIGVMDTGESFDLLEQMYGVRKTVKVTCPEPEPEIKSCSETKNKSGTRSEIQTSSESENITDMQSSDRNCADISKDVDDLRDMNAKIEYDPILSDEYFDADSDYEKESKLCDECDSFDPSSGACSGRQSCELVLEPPGSHSSRPVRNRKAPQRYGNPIVNESVHF